MTHSRPMMMHGPAHRQRGFTLLEVLVAIAIFALISAMAYSGLANVLRASERVEHERATWREFAMFCLRLEEDLAQARPRPIRDVDDATSPAMLGQATDTRPLGAPTVEFTRGGIYLPPAADTQSQGATTPDPRRAARSDLQRVAYRLTEGKLLRLTWPSLDRAPQSQPQETVMLREVEDFEVRYYSANDGWVDNWPPRAANGLIQNPADLPRGVEIRLTVKGRGEFKRLFLLHE